jgi:poly-gamma-glutamate synthesis protein (capsule biosynthesis protein)
VKLFVPILLVLLFSATAPAEPIIMNAVGDIMLAGSSVKTLERFGYDYPFGATEKILKNADIVFGNLEAPITRSGVEFVSKKYRFRQSPHVAGALRNAGFTHLALANNHILDFGETGFNETKRFLEREGIAFFGAGHNLATARKAWFSEIRGVKIAFLAYSLVYPEEFFAGDCRPGTAPGYSSLFTADIRQAKKSADYVIVSFHWGTEGAETPKPYQVAAGHKAIDAGADIVIGHHPHVLQGIEYYGPGIIFYSLGNFAFGSLSRTAASSMIARITLDNGIKEVELIPLEVLNSKVRFQPQILAGSRGNAAAKPMYRLSREMGTQINLINGRHLATRDIEEIALKK